jgi:hypothetical protein
LATGNSKYTCHCSCVRIHVLLQLTSWVSFFKSMLSVKSHNLSINWQAGLLS